MNKKIRNILKIIKFTPPFMMIIITATILLVFLLNNEEKKEFIQSEKIKIELNVKNAYDFIKSEKESLEKELNKELKRKVENAYKIAMNIYLKNKDKKPKDEIIREINETLSQITFEDNHGYFTFGSNRNILETKNFEKIELKKRFEPYNLNIILTHDNNYFKHFVRNKLLSHLKKIRYDGNKYIRVINYKGDFLFHPLSNNQEKEIFLDKDFLNNKNKLELKIENDLKYIYSLKFDDLNWVLFSEFNLSEANLILEQRYDKYKKNIFIYGVGFTLVLLMISLFISKRLEDEFLKFKFTLENKKNEFETFFQLLINLQLIADVKTGEVVQINNASKTMLGYETEELIGTTFLDLVHPDDVKPTIDEMTKLSMGKIVYYFENRYKHKDGSYVDLAWCAATDNENKLIYATAQNITQHKSLEKEKEYKEKILHQQSKMAAMGEMLGNIAHQWRQPLSAISTLATGSKIQKEMDCLSDEQFNLAMDKINSTSQYLSQTIDDFRSFFNPTKNKEREFEVSESIEKALKLVDAQFTAKEIVIEQEVKEFKLFSFENELVQVLINILNNARDALVLTKNKKRVIFIKSYSINNTLYIEILDNAGGIKEDILDRVFEPYFTTKHESVGTGIGLYMSNEIVKKHLNGSLDVSNEHFTYEDIEYVGAKFLIKIDI